MDKEQLVRRAFNRTRQEQPQLSEPDALVLALMTAMSYLKGSAATGIVAEFRPSERPYVTAAVNAAFARTDTTSNAITKAVQYVLLAHHLTDIFTMRASSRERAPIPKWTTILTLMLSDEERLDVVDHLSPDGVIPMELVETIYVG